MRPFRGTGNCTYQPGLFAITELRRPPILLDPQVAQQPVEHLLAGVVLLPAGEVAEAAN
jgi:hypothetical protein